MNKNNYANPGLQVPLLKNKAIREDMIKHLTALKMCLSLDKVRHLSSIHEAVRFGDVTELQAMVQSGAGINDLDPKFKFTPLHWGCNYGSLEVLIMKHRSKQILIIIYLFSLITTVSGRYLVMMSSVFCA